MAITTQKKQITLEAAKATWGKAHCRKVTTAADIAGQLGGTYFELNRTNALLVEVPEYVWFDVDDTDIDPAVSGKTGIEVDISSGDSAAVIAAAIKAALTNYKVSLSGAELTIENRFIGAITAESNATSGFTLEVLASGLSVELGATEGAIELALEGSFVDITSNQTGGLILDQIFQGSKATVSMNVLEVSKANFDALVGEVVGDNLTPVAGTKLSGYGESRLFKSMFDLGGTLILHPIRLEDADKSADYVFWKTAPKPESLNFDGTAAQVMAITFESYLDPTTNKKINLFARGDWSQDGLSA